MKIIIDSRMINMSGIGRYIQNLLKDNKYNDEISLLVKDKNEVNQYKNKKIKYDSEIYGIKEQVKFPYHKIERKSILHIPHYNIPLFYKGILITTIHDITHILFPQYLPNKFALYYAKLMIKLAVFKSNYILTVSENTKNDLIKYFNADEKKIIVTYNGVDGNFRTKNQIEYEYLYKKYKIDRNKKILLYVGNKKPHKNISTIFKAMSVLEEKENYILILTGKGFETYTELEDLSKELDLKDNIIHTGIVTDEELVDIYNLADIFVFPSFYEGFGIPPLEAMACGTPVVCSNTSSLPEVVGDAAYLFDPNEEIELKKAIEILSTDEQIYNMYVQKGYDRIKLFTWSKCRKLTEEVYEKCENLK